MWRVVLGEYQFFPMLVLSESKRGDRDSQVINILEKTDNVTNNMNCERSAQMVKDCIVPNW